MSVNRPGGNNAIADAARRAAADGKVTKAEAQGILDVAGNSVSAREERQLKDAFEKTIARALDPEAKAFVRETMGTIAQMRAYSEQRNAMVAARAPTLERAEAARLKAGVATESLGGTRIPEDVKTLVREALKAGAVAYDVSELSGPAKDDHGEGYTVAGKWTPYPQDSDPVGNLAFSYTEITPQKLEDDMKEHEFTRIKGYRTETQRDFRTGETHTFQVAEYERVRARGTGDISAHYDEASHTDEFARGTGNQKWASNFSIMSDGSVHALPAARRNNAQRGLILTNPSLGRGERMLFNGHLEVRGGVVVSVGMSGRIQKAAAEGDAKFIDPVPLLKAWGFKCAPNLKVTFEGGGADPKVDDTTHVIGN